MGGGEGNRGCEIGEVEKVNGQRFPEGDGVKVEVVAGRGRESVKRKKKRGGGRRSRKEDRGRGRGNGKGDSQVDMNSEGLHAMGVLSAKMLTA
jgi:hypothetical protein